MPPVDVGTYGCVRLSSPSLTLDPYVPQGLSTLV